MMLKSRFWTNSFLQIHPFVDMNGRVSRILLCALILNKFKAPHLSKNFVSGIFGTDAGRLAYIEANQRRVDFGDCNALRSLPKKNLLTELID